MNTPDRLQVVHTVAQRKTDAQSQVVQQTQQTAQAARERLLQLTSYREDYLVRLRDLEQQAFDPVRFHEGRRFLLQLGDVIGLQTQEVSRCQEQVRQATAILVQHLQYQKNLERLMAERRQQAQAERDKKEQARIDDLSGQRHVWRQRHASGGMS